MLTSKQRAKLRAVANTIETLVQIGKEGISGNVIKSVDEALTAREIVKIKLLETAPCTVTEAAETLVQALSADPVQKIGAVLVLYRESEREERRNEYLKGIK